MAKTVKRKKPSASLIARRVNQFAWESADDPEAGRLEKVYYGVSNRMKAKKAGRDAAKLIAKARKAKIKKAALTKVATRSNDAANKVRTRAAEEKIVAAGKNGYIAGSSVTRGNRDNMKVITRTAATAARKFAKSNPTSPDLDRAKALIRRADKLDKISKAAARKSGGTATGIKRTAEAAIARIAEGKALKGMARAGGVLGMVGMFTQALRGTESKKNKRG